ncbi:MAG TPA: hypothetical protein VLZ30_09825, partial [Verrucomicrobiae bacterium]|nr:hypothetical protein [Verrucomicrobiae bacterium]
KGTFPLDHTPCTPVVCIRPIMRRSRLEQSPIFLRRRLRKRKLDVTQLVRSESEATIFLSGNHDMALSFKTLEKKDHMLTENENWRE